MNKIYSIFLRLSLLFISLTFSHVLKAQEIISTTNRYYYNNFDNGQLGTAFTQIGANPALAVTSTASVNNLTTNSGYSLSSTGNGLAGGLQMSFMTEGGDLNTEVYGHEWTFLYRNSGDNPDNSDIIDNGENAWKFWFLTESANINTSRGYYLTQVGNNLQLRYRYNNSTDASQYNNIISFNLSSIGGNNTTYAIRVQRLKRGSQFVWHLFVDPYSANVKEAVTERGGTGAYEGTLNLYANSKLLVSSTTAGRFKFDEFKFYSMKLEITGANDTSNGISNPLFAAQTDAVLYGLEIRTRGYFDIYQMVFNLSGNITSIIQGGTMKLMRSTDNFFGNNDDYFIANLEFYNQAAQNYNMYDKFWSIGNDDGSNKTVGYYFVRANVRADASTSQSYSFVGAPVLISESAQINYVANGDVTNTVAPPASSGIVYDWQGGTSTNWTVSSNWSPVGVPGENDVARIGVVNYGANQPLLNSGTSNVGNVIIGTTKASVITINGTLNILSALTIRNLADADFSPTLAGTGTLNVRNLIVGNNTEGTIASATASNTTLNQTINDLNISGALILNGVYKTISSNFRANNAGVNVASGKNLKINELRSFHVNQVNVSKVVLNNANLIITGASAINSISALGKTYILTPASGNSLIEYSSAIPQNVYTDFIAFSDNPLVGTPVIGYSSLKFSGAGQKNVLAGILNVKNQWTSEQGRINLSSNNVTVNFNGGAQTITDNNTDGGIGVYFRNVNLSSGVKQLAGTGRFSISSGSILTLASGTTFNIDSKLTLKSDANGFASIAPINGATINGNVNAEVYFTGGPGKRGTRMFAPPIDDTGMMVSGRSFYQQMKEHMVITGAGAEVNGFDPGSALNPFSPTIYKYNEPATETQAQFTPITSLLTGTVPSAKPGEGFFFAYRGNRDNYNPLNPTESLKLFPEYVPESFSPVFTGTVNQGNVSVAIQNSNNPTDPNNGYNVLGNPYAATLDWEQLYASNSSGLENELKIITPGGAIMTRKNVGGVITVVNGSIDNAQYIQPGQGFYVKKITQGTSTFTFSENHKNTNIAPNRYLSLPNQNGLLSMMKMQTGSGIQTSAIDPGMVDFRIKLSDEFNSDETAILFKDGFSENFDGVDAAYLGGSTVSLSSFSEDGKLAAINYMPELGVISTIKLRTTATYPTDDATEVNATLSFPNTKVLSNYQVILKDAYLNKEINVRETPAYNFTFLRNVAASSGNNRFSLNFTMGNSPSLDLSKFEASQVDQYIKIDWKTASELSSINFEIEHSTDGQNFSKIGDVSGAGDSFTEVDYSFNFLNAVHGKNFFRLKQVYVDGTFNYSQIIEADFIIPATTKFNYFLAKNISNKVELSWEIEADNSIVKFEIEKSFNEISYDKIYEITDLGSTSFVYDDLNPQIGLNAYRLKIIYADNSFGYSEVRMVDFKSSIDLLSFDYVVEDTEILFSWTSLTERAADKYILERSEDGNTFTTVGEIKAIGNSNTPNSYSITDKNPIEGIIKHRLRLEHEDASSSFSNVIDVAYRKPFVSYIQGLELTQISEKVLVKWETLKEEGSLKFGVERSVNGVDFNEIVQVAGQGNLSTSFNYVFEDLSPPLGEVHYRLKHYFTDGKFVYSESEKINVKKVYSFNLSSFSVIQDDLTALILWETSKEENTLNFELERSINGLNFTPIYYVPAAGNSTVSRTYSRVDLNPFEGINYYRLKQNNGDGTFNYSSIKSIVFTTPFVFNLSSFTVSKVTPTTARLDFVVSSERQASKYVIERSFDGINYLPIGELAAKGNFATPNNYSYIDTNPFKDKTFYRIKYYNTKGDFLISYPQVIDFGDLVTLGKQNLTVYPNPATEYIEINMTVLPVQLKIYSLSGKLLKTSRFEKGEHIRQNVSDLSNGIYIVELFNIKDNVILGSAKFYKN